MPELQQPVQQQPTPEATAEQQPSQGQPDITQQIEEGINSLPQDTKEILAAFAIAPEFSQLLGELIGPEIGQFFTQFADPEMTLVAVPRAALDEVMAASSEATELGDEPGSMDTTTGTNETVPAEATPPI